MGIGSAMETTVPSSGMKVRMRQATTHGSVMYIQAHHSEQRAARPNGFLQPVDDELLILDDKCVVQVQGSLMIHDGSSQLFLIRSGTEKPHGSVMYVQAHFSELRAARPNCFFQPIDEELLILDERCVVQVQGSLMIHDGSSQLFLTSGTELLMYVLDDPTASFMC